MPRSHSEYRDYMRDYMKRRYYERRAEAVRLLGGRCVVCGTTEGLEIDHVDRTKKSINPDRMTSVGRPRFLAEVAKCQLLCETHHKQKSAAEQSVDHGGGLTGKRNCYCEKCGPLKKRYMRSRREAARSTATQAPVV